MTVRGTSSGNAVKDQRTEFLELMESLGVVAFGKYSINVPPEFPGERFSVLSTELGSTRYPAIDWGIQTVQIPEILKKEQTDNAVTLLRRYYTETGSKGRVRTGARFDTWAGGGTAPDVVNTITADDMLAASFLSVRFSPRASIGILETRREDITALLSQIPVDLDLTALSHDEVKKVLGEESAAWQLWDLLRGNDLPKKEKWGIGPTKASKLLARKRPRLIPIWDSVVKSETGLKNSLTQWDDWHSALTEKDCVLARHLDNVQERAELPHRVSRLRAMDVVLWMHGTGGGVAQPPAGEDEEA